MKISAIQWKTPLSISTLLLMTLLLYIPLTTVAAPCPARGDAENCNIKCKVLRHTGGGHCTIRPDATLSCICN